MGAFRDAILGAKNGDSKAVELLYDQFSPLLLKCSMVNGCLLYTSDAADE